MTAERNPILVATQDALRDAVQRLRASPRLALDVEADGYFRYRAKLCVLQLASSDEVVIVDTLALTDLAPLRPLLGADGPLKLVHDAAFDARLLVEARLPLAHVLDTSVCARFLGELQSGLASLLDKRLGVKLSKEKQMHDWAERPLGPDDVRYLAEDVRHLPALADLLLADAALRDVLPAVEEETRWVLARAEEPPAPPPPPWTRIKGAQALPSRERGVLHAACLAREAIAKARDLPPFRVVVNDVLLVLAKKQPRRIGDFARIAPRVARDTEVATALLDAVTHGLAAGDAPAEERARPLALPPAEREARRAREKALTDWRKREATLRSVDVQVVLPGHCVADLVAATPVDRDGLARIAGLGAFRIERDGEALLACLRAPPPPPPEPVPA